MVTATVPQRTVTPKAEKSRVEVSAPSRREFLYYIWAASMILCMGEAAAGLIWFTLPRFKEGEFGGIFQLDPAEIPPAGIAPFTVPEGRFHVSHLEDDTLVILYQVCTHLGCLPKWVETNHRFECPCHGSKYELNGKWIEGPAPRSLDRFRTTITFSDGSTNTMNDDGDPIPLEGRVVASININTSDRIKRKGRV
jgi:cytochrome b6-f complex iron-sulfur subunit